MDGEGFFEAFLQAGRRRGVDQLELGLEFLQGGFGLDRKSVV